MRERCELRILEDYACLLLRSDEGKRLGAIARKVVLATDDPRFLKVGEIQKDIHEKEGRSFFFGWTISRSYTRSELALAELFHLIITSVFEPAGEECGTVYDVSGVCPECGAGRMQLSPLILDVRRLPRGKDIAKTISDEVIISARLATALHGAGLTGYELGPVVDVNTCREITEWSQLKVVSAPMDLVSPTQFGVDPFDHDEEGSYRCALGHVSGLNVLSELYLQRGKTDGSDLAVTKQLIGRQSGLLVPRQLYLVSPRTVDVLKQIGAKGHKAEVAYLCD